MPGFQPLRRAAEQAAIPLALLLLLLLVAGLTWQVHARDRSHQELAGQAVRDYAAFAAWEFSRHAGGGARERIEYVLRAAYQLRPGRNGPLPPPSVLGPASAAGSCACGWDRANQLAFRVKLDNGEIATHVPAAAALRAALERARPVFHAAAVAGVGRRVRTAPPEDTPPVPSWVRVAHDTANAERIVLAFTIVRDPDERPLAAYGVVARPELVTRSFNCTVDDQPLLPPSLTRGAPNDSMLRLRVEFPDGGVAYARGADGEPRPAGSRTFLTSAYAAADTMHASLGGLVTVVELRPEIASTLLIGGVPSSRLPQLLLVLSLAVTLAALALVQLRRARELSRLRSQFVANVSHELRTPLAQISMFSETLLLERERSPDERQRFLSLIFREARRLTTLVEGVLRFSRGEAGATRLRPEPRDLATDVRDAMAAFRPLAEAGRVTLCERLPLEAWAMADGGAVRQILLNLLDNAVKYGPRGQVVTLCVDEEHEPGGARYVRLTVSDQGSGIPPAERAAAFEPFARLEQSARIAGAGIGLSVVRELVRAQGGRVWITDAIPHGAAVHVTLPAARAAECTDESSVTALDLQPVGEEEHQLAGAAR